MLFDLGLHQLGAPARAGGVFMCPALISGWRVTRVSFQGTSSMSISMIRTLGSTAQRLALMKEERWL